MTNCDCDCIVDDDTPPPVPASPPPDDPTEETKPKEEESAPEAPAETEQTPEQSEEVSPTFIGSFAATILKKLECVMCQNCCEPEAFIYTLHWRQFVVFFIQRFF